MIFLNSSYLWALLGLAVPVAIHLWSKREGKTIKIGSIRLLREGDPKQTSNLKLNELLLLLLRMLIISLLVVIMAEPQIKKENKGTQLTYLIEPALLSYEEMTSFLDTLDSSSETKIRLLESGFPDYEKEELNKNSNEVPDYWQLAKQMNELKTDSLVVFTSAYISGIKGKRPQVSKNINWVVLDFDKPLRKVIAAAEKEDEIELLSVISDATSLKFGRELVASEDERISKTSGNDSILMTEESGEMKLPVRHSDSLAVLIVENEILKNESRYLQSAYKAIAAYLERPLEIQVVEPENVPQETEIFNTVVWLNPKPEIQTSAPLLIFRKDSLAGKIIEQGNTANEFYLTNQLNSENIVEEHLPEKLLKLLGIKKDLNQEIQKYDRRKVALEELQPVLTAGSPGKIEAESTGFQQYLWLLLLTLLITERGVARYRKQ